MTRKQVIWASLTVAGTLAWASPSYGTQEREFAGVKEAYAYFGASVDISGDYAIVGADMDDNTCGTDAGEAYVYKWGGSYWYRQGNLNDCGTGGDQDYGDRCGTSVATDGTYAAVGCPYADYDGYTNLGMVLIFKRSGSYWDHLVSIGPPSSDRTNGDLFGWSVDYDGSKLIVGAPYWDDTYFNQGAVYFWHRSGDTWTYKGRLRDSNGDTNALLGWSVSISGNRAIAGAPFDDPTYEDQGSAMTFRYANFFPFGWLWAVDQKLVSQSRGLYFNFGRSIAISGDFAVVGSPYYKYQGIYMCGAVDFFHTTGGWGNWSGQNMGIGSSHANYDYFGWSVGMDGETAVVGAWGENGETTDSGVAYLFVYDDVTEYWDRDTRFWALTGWDAGDRFGISVAIDGSDTIVGAEADDYDSIYNCGSAYIDY